MVILSLCKSRNTHCKIWQFFQNEYQQTGMIDEIEYFRIISYSNEEASVFYVLEDHSAGVVLSYRKEQGSWKLQRWEAIWSTTGSADGFYWPYYR